MTPTCRSTTSRPRRTCSGWPETPTLSKQFTAQIDGCTRYLTLQTDSGPTAKLEVRRRSTTRSTSKRSSGRSGRDAADPSSTILTPPLVGYQKYDLYATPDNRGDPAKAKELLTQAGYPNGVTLTMVSQTSGEGPRILTSLQESLGRAGIKLKNKGYNYPAIYTDSLQLTSKKDEHQVGQAAWCADWPGNGARTFCLGRAAGRARDHPAGQQQLRRLQQREDRPADRPGAHLGRPGRRVGGLGCCRQAGDDRRSLRVPLTYDKRGKFWSTRVKNYKFSQWVVNASFTNIWLDPNTP